MGPVLETPRLLLRPPVAEDFEGWAAMMADEASRFIGGPQPRAVAWRGFMSVAGAWAMSGHGMFSVIEKDSGRWIGRVGPWVPEGWPGTEVGWGLVKDAYGQGYATEAAVATIDWAFDTLGWTDVIHCIDPANVASQRVAERLGSTNRGPGKLPPPFDDQPIDLWGQTRDAWRARRR
ncbi:MAG TPA: GNAT family N-acetyltransferase [Caulobacteraceae bacterium]|jgi:RimJ/RimL family protein N-acetyltransferase|nr:GNAT family N-acetyltransferase [Caulobacteraceae bacterium]